MSIDTFALVVRLLMRAVSCYFNTFCIIYKKIIFLIFWCGNSDFPRQSALIIYNYHLLRAHQSPTIHPEYYFHLIRLCDIYLVRLIKW